MLCLKLPQKKNKQVVLPDRGGGGSSNRRLSLLVIILSVPFNIGLKSPSTSFVKAEK